MEDVALNKKQLSEVIQIYNSTDQGDLISYLDLTLYFSYKRSSLFVCKYGRCCPLHELPPLASMLIQSFRISSLNQYPAF